MKAFTINRSKRSNSQLISDILELKEVPPVTTMSRDEVFIKHTHVGINFDDINFIKKDTLLPGHDTSFPIPGFEGVGEIIKVGSNVKGFQVGQRVCYPFSLPGAFTEKRTIHNSLLIGIPNELSSLEVAATIRKGLTASYLLYNVMKIAQNSYILIHSIAGGVGHLLAQWARSSTLQVIGTIGHESKRQFAEVYADLVVNRNKEDLVKEVEKFTNRKGVAVVYDSVGADVFDASIGCLSTFGTYINFGSSSSPLNPFDSEMLEPKSLFFTRPRLEHYKNNRMDLILSCDQLFNAMIKGFVKTSYQEYDFESLPSVCNDLADGKTTGCAVVTL